ncbi:MAG: cytochrome P450 [Actinomycetota bacterium]
MATSERVESPSRVDLGNPDNWVEGVPHDGFDWLREHEPVSLHSKGGSDFYALVRYEDVVAAGKDWKTFSSLKGFTIEDAVGGAELMMTSMDPPRHDSIRRLVNQGFTPRRVIKLEEHIREIGTELIDRIAPKGQADFVVDLAAELPLQVILEMIGVPESDRHKVFEWSNTMLGNEDPEYGNSMEKATQAAMEMYMYWEWLSHQAERDRNDDLIQALLDAELDGGEKLTRMDIDAFLLLLVVAGNETTRNLISGGMYTLFQNPGQWQRLLERPELLVTGVEEMLRYIAPVMYFRRTATHDVEIGGSVIPEGGRVALWFIAANRDPNEFPDPHRFDVTRQPNEHVAFGAGGPHYCLGANLARLEIRIMFEELLRRMPDVEQAGEISRLRSNFISGIKHMPVRFTPSSS